MKVRCIDKSVPISGIGEIEYRHMTSTLPVQSGHISWKLMGLNKIYYFNTWLPVGCPEKTNGITAAGTSLQAVN